MRSCYLSLIIVAGFALPASGQQPPPPTDVSGSVTLPYSELKSLLAAAQPKPTPTPAPAKAPAPPVPFSVQAARYEIHLGADPTQATGQVVFEVLTFAEGWTAVPLLPANELRLASVSPEGALVTVRDGVYTLLLDGPGRCTVTLGFSVDVADGETPRTRAVRLAKPSALVNELSVTGVPAGWLAEVSNAARAADDKGGGSPLRFQLAADQPLELTLVNAEDRKPAPPPAPSVWQAEAQSLVRYDEGQLVYKTRLRLGADTGAGLSVELTLPAAANVLSITGDDLARWRVVKADAGDARQLEISWKTSDILRRELLLNYEIAQTASDDAWQLVSPQVVSGDGRLRDALYALPTIAGVEFTTGDKGKTPLAAGDAQQLPRWLAGEIGGGNFVAVNNAVLVGVHRLPLMRTVRATVEESRFHTRLVADGALLSEGTMSVRHDGPLTFGLSLPPETQLLACSINGRDALPVDRGGGRMDLSLPADAAGKPTRIDLSYTGHQPKMEPVSGQVALTLPETDLFVQTLYWDLEIPGDYELTALEGNVALASVANAPPGIHLRKDLLNAERPAAELFYQKHAVNP